MKFSFFKELSANIRKRHPELVEWATFAPKTSWIRGSTELTMTSAHHDVFQHLPKIPCVGLVTWDFDPPRGGLGRALQEMVGALRGEGISVEVLSSSSKSPFSRFWFSVTLFWRLSHWIDRHAINILLLPTGPGGLFLVRKPKNCRCIVLSYHTYLQQARLVPGEWWKRIFVPFERRTLRMASVFCYCEDTQKVVREEYGIRNIQLIPQILDLEQWKKRNVGTSAKYKHVMVSPNEPSCLHLADTPLSPHSNYLCLFIGRPDRRKGIHILRKAWENVSKRLPNATLKIIDCGDLPQAELIILVQSADLVVYPSYLEGFGLVVAQAMASGTAVIACDSDGIRCLIRHDETGWLVPRGDADALAAGIVHLLRDHSLRARLAASAQDDILTRCKREQSASVLLQELRKF